MRARLAALAAAALALPACSAPETVPAVPEPPPSVSAPASPSAVPSPGDLPSAVTSPSLPAQAAPRPAAKRQPRLGSAERFVTAVHARLPHLAVDRRDDELTELGLQACRAAGAGLGEYGLDAPDARRLTAVAHAELCPQ